MFYHRAIICHKTIIIYNQILSLKCYFVFFVLTLVDTLLFRPLELILFKHTLSSSTSTMPISIASQHSVYRELKDMLNNGAKTRRGNAITTTRFGTIMYLHIAPPKNTKRLEQQRGDTQKNKHGKFPIAWDNTEITTSWLLETAFPLFLFGRLGCSWWPSCRIRICLAERQCLGLGIRGLTLEKNGSQFFAASMRALRKFMRRNGTTANRRNGGSCGRD